jgi:hypothetical protein
MGETRKQCKWLLNNKGYGMVRFDLAQPYVSLGFLEEAKKVILDNLAIARRIAEQQKEENKLDVPRDDIKNKLAKLKNF